MLFTQTRSCFIWKHDRIFKLEKNMPTVIEETTVQDLIQELQSFPSDAPVRLKDGDELRYLIAGFQAGSDGVTIILADDDGDDDSDDDDDDQQ